jgi:hypothetical protein
MNGNAVMYDVGKILTLGGSTAYGEGTGAGAPATNAAAVITLTGTQASVRSVAPMAFARGYSSSVVLPDGKVFVSGGMPFPIPFSDTNAILQPGACPPYARRAACPRCLWRLSVMCKVWAPCLGQAADKMRWK